MLKTLLIFPALAVSVVAALPTTALAQYANVQQCAAASFPGRDQITLTNTCSIKISALWEDDSGRKRAILGPGESYTGTLRGRARWWAERCDRGC